MEKRETDILDYKGESHHYILTTWDYDKATRMQELLFGLIVEPLVSLSMAGNANAGGDAAVIEQAESSLAGILATIPSKLSAIGLGPLCKDVLKGVRRSDKDKDGNELAITLDDNSLTFSCYTGGNSTELYQAVYWVMKENIFPFGIDVFLKNLGVFGASKEG